MLSYIVLNPLPETYGGDERERKEVGLAAGGDRWRRGNESSAAFPCTTAATSNRPASTLAHTRVVSVLAVQSQPIPDKAVKMESNLASAILQSHITGRQNVATPAGSRGAAKILGSLIVKEYIPNAHTLLNVDSRS